jgi:hypothetical protein
MKKFVIVSTAIVAFSVTLGLSFGKTAAQNDERIPLGALSGSYSIKGRGSEAICLNADSAPVDCHTKGALAKPATVLFVGHSERNEGGSECSTYTVIFSDLPVGISLPLVTRNVHRVITTTSYDSATGTGETIGGTFAGGKCDGANFNTDGATDIGRQTSHFAASNGGRRIDTILTSAKTFVPGLPGGNIVGDFSLSITQRKQ